MTPTVRATHHKADRGNIGYRPTVLETVRATAKAYVSSLFGVMQGSNVSPGRPLTSLVQGSGSAAPMRIPLERSGHSCVSSAQPMAAVTIRTIESRADRDSLPLSDFSSNLELTARQSRALAARVGCGRGGRLSDLQHIKHLACSVGDKNKVIDPVDFMKAQIVRSQAFVFSKTCHQSGRGQGILPCPQMIQWQRAYGRFATRNIPEQLLKQLRYVDGPTVDRCRQELECHLPMTDVLERAVSRLPRAFQAEDVQQAIIDRLGDHVVFGGVIGVSGYMIEQPGLSEQKRQSTDEPERWALQSVRLEPIAQFLSDRALKKLESQPAGRDFISAQCLRNAAGDRVWRSRKMNWVS